MDIIKLYKQNATARSRYLDEAVEIAELTCPSLEPLPTGTSGSAFSSTKELYRRSSTTDNSLNRPYSNAGASAVNGLASTLTSTLSPTNVRFFRLIPDPSLNLGEEDSRRVGEIFVTQERRIESFLAQFNFLGFSNSAIRRMLVEGSCAVKVDANNGFMLYPLRSFTTTRRFGTVETIILEEVVAVEDRNGETKELSQYILVDKAKRKVYVQREGERKARLTDENSDQYFVFSAEIPTLDDYARSYYADHVGLLNAINEGSRALIEAQKSASWNFLIFTGSSEVPLHRIANIKNRDVIRLQTANDIVPFHGFGTKISEWSFVAQKLRDDEQRILALSAVGLQSRAAQINTATEVNAIRAELDAIVGAVSQTISDTFHKNVITALLSTLEIKQGIGGAFLAQGVSIDDDTLSKLITPIVTTGVPALNRENDSEKLLTGLLNLSRVVGPNILQFVNVPQVVKTYLDGLRISTEGLINIEMANQMMAQQQAMIQQQQQAMVAQQQQAMVNATEGQAV